MRQTTIPFLTTKKEAAKFQKGGSEAIMPSGDFKKALASYKKSPNPDPIVIKKVTICVVTNESAKYIECEPMHDNMVVPGVQCMFLVNIEYPWQIKSYAKDHDTILTDGEKFYIVTRSLATSPFVLNEYSKTKLNSAITEFVEGI